MADLPFVDLRLGDSDLAKGILRAVGRVTSRGWYILGPEVELFEDEFAAHVDRAYGVGVASGTDALTLTLMALGIGPDDEVVTSPLTAPFTALAICRAGARPIFADVDPDTLNLSPAAVEKRIGPHTRAILPVHLYGNPCDMTSFCALAEQSGLHLVEDACQAHGARLHGRATGSWGRAACFSFYPTKNLGALGDGGLVVTNDDEMARRLRRLRNGGQAERYRHDELGLNSRLDELQAAVLRAKLPYLTGWNERRRALAALYREKLSGTRARPVGTTPGAETAMHLFVIRVPDRDGLQAFLRERGIETLVHYPLPLHLQPAYRSLGGQGPTLEVAEVACREILSLPLHPALSASSVESVSGAVASYFS